MRARLVGERLGEPAYATLGQALEAAARTELGVRLVDAQENEQLVSFAELLASARRVAARLMEQGVRGGERVALVLPTGRDFLDGFFGALLAGAAPVPLYPPVRLGRMDEYERQTAAMLRTAQACVVLSDRRTRLLLGKAVEQARPRGGCPTVEELRDGSRHEASREVSGEALALVQFSSGSTVDPKPVALTHANLLAQCAALKALLVEQPGTRQAGVSWLPLYHDMGLIGCLLLAVYYPGPLVLMGPELFLARPALWLRAISRHRATISPAPSFAYALCLKRVRDEELRGVDLSSWQYALNGAEPVSVEVMERFARRFARYGLAREALMPVYGLSEASLAVTFTPRSGEKRSLDLDAAALALRGQALQVPADERARRLPSVGLPVPGAEVEIRDAAGAPLDERRVGRVWVRAPFVMQGYLDSPEATARALVGGWLDTGDVGFVDGGELFVCGRAKDVIIVRGANHAPQSFEACLDELPGVRAGCAVAVGWVPPGGSEEQVLLLVETTPEPPAELADLVAAEVTARTGIRPGRVELLLPGTLPRTSSGKLRRGEALRRFVAGELAPPRPVTALSMAREVARSAAAFARTKWPPS